MKKHAVYLTVDELTDIIIAYDGSITLLKENRRKMEESTMIKEKFPHMPKMYTDSIEEEQRMMKKLIKIRNELKSEEETNMVNRKDLGLIISLCKDIARHASQLEAESQGVKQSTDRYLELKNLLINHYLQGENNFEIILEEFCKSIQNAGGWDNEEETTVSIKNHMLCIFEYFLMLVNEINKEVM